MAFENCKKIVVNKLSLFNFLNYLLFFYEIYLFFGRPKHLYRMTAIILYTKNER